MLKIFAKKGTDEKVLVPCPRENVGEVMTLLNKKFDGDWILVDKLKPTGEILRFNDGLIYQGYSDKITRYSKAIDNIDR